MSARSLPLLAIAALAAAVIAAGCASSVGQTTTSTTTTKTTPAAPAAASSPQDVKPAEHAIQVLAGALRDGDVHRLCRPGAVFTSAVIAGMRATGQSCESSLELSAAVREPPTLTVTHVAVEPGLATAQVRVGSKGVIPLDIVHTGRRWLVSFSDGEDPVAAVGQ
jgi:hypothetical protein